MVNIPTDSPQLLTNAHELVGGSRNFDKLYSAVREDFQRDDIGTSYLLSQYQHLERSKMLIVVTLLKFKVDRVEELIGIRIENPEDRRTIAAAIVDQGYVRDDEEELTE